MPTASSGDYLTIVSGLPRSGTSMMMQMIHHGGREALTDRIRAADTDNPRGYYEFEPAKKTAQDPSWVGSGTGKVVKMVYRLLFDLPAGHDYRVVLMRRNLDEVLASQAKMLARLQTGGASLDQQAMARLYEKELARTTTWLTEQPNFRFLEVNYNDLLRTPAPAAAAVNRFLDGALDEAAMVSAVDPSLYRNRSQA